MTVLLRRCIASVGFRRSKKFRHNLGLNRNLSLSFQMALQGDKSLEQVIDKASKRKIAVSFPPGIGLGDVSEVIVIGGWWGGKLNHVLKYSELVRSLRPNAALIACVPSQMLGVFKRYKGVTNELLEVMNDVSGGTSNQVDVTLYYFSNGGLFLHEHMADYFQKSESNLKLKSIVLDSCPAYITPESGAKALNNGKSSPVLLTCFKILEPFSKRWGQNWWTWLEKVDLKVPEMYIFSRGDDITDASKIEELMDVRKEKGIDVKSHIFEDSPHVLHYKVHPEEYKEALDAFLNA